MATQVIELSNTEWTRVTASGESGTCWKKTAGPVLIDHTDQETADTLPTSNVNVSVDKSKRVPLDEDDNEVLCIAADNSLDIYYAISLGGDNDKIVVDVL